MEPRARQTDRVDVLGLSDDGGGARYKRVRPRPEAPNIVCIIVLGLQRCYALKLETMPEERTSRLPHANRLDFPGTFASAIAHEIANPATFISGIVADLKRFRGQAASIPARRAGEDETDVIDETMEDVVPMRASAPI